MVEEIKSTDFTPNYNIKPYLIGIAGGSASGKTSVSQILFRSLGISDCIMVSMDSYYKDITLEQRERLNEYNFDHPDAFDFDLLYEHLDNLLEGKEVNVPIYDFTTSKRNGFTPVKPSNLIIFEGILALYDKRISDLMDMKIFVDTDDDIRLARRIYRDINERGRNLQSVLQRYNDFVKPAFDEFIRPTRKIADVIIPRGAENSVAINLVVQNLIYQKSKLFSFSSSNTSNNNTENAKVLNITLTNHDIIDSKCSFIQNLLVPTEQKQLDVYKKILEDYLNCCRLDYSQMFLDFLLNELLKLYTTENKITKNSLILTLKDKFDPTIAAKSDKLILFAPCLLINDDLEKLNEFLGEFNRNVEIISLFVSPKFIQQASNRGDGFKITSIYFSDTLTKYNEILVNGFSAGKDEGDFSSSLNVFSAENICVFFKIFAEKFREIN